MKVDKGQFLAIALAMSGHSALTGCGGASTGGAETTPANVSGDPAPVPLGQSRASTQGSDCPMGMAPYDECVSWDPSGECAGWEPDCAPTEECVDWDPSGECVAFESEGSYGSEPYDECTGWDPSGECIEWASTGVEPTIECVGWDPTGECVDWVENVCDGWDEDGDCVQWSEVPVGKADGETTK